MDLFSPNSSRNDDGFNDRYSDSLRIIESATPRLVELLKCDKIIVLNKENATEREIDFKGFDAFEVGSFYIRGLQFKNSRYSFDAVPKYVPFYLMEGDPFSRYIDAGLENCERRGYALPYGFINIFHDNGSIKFLGFVSLINTLKQIESGDLLPTKETITDKGNKLLKFEIRDATIIKY